MQVHWEGKSFLVRYQLSGLDEELPGRPAMVLARLLFGDHDGTLYEPFFSFLVFVPLSCSFSVWICSPS